MADTDLVRLTNGVVTIRVSVDTVSQLGSEWHPVKTGKTT